MDVKLSGNIIEHMRSMDVAEHDRFRYFLYDSKLWRAIEREVTNDGTPLVDHPADHSIPSYRGTGPGVSLKGTHLYAPDYVSGAAKEADVFCMDVEVEYVCSDDKDMEDPTVVRRRYSLNVPVDLELNFTEVKFKGWIKQLREKRDAKSREKDLKELARLLKKYPEMR